MASLHTLLQDMYQLEKELSEFELKFGVKSTDFHAAMTAGELDEFDALDDYRMDFIEWLGLYETWLSLLASTHPHHKHIHPNIKRNSIPTPNLSFTRPNLPFLIGEVEADVLNVPQ